MSPHCSGDKGKPADRRRVATDQHDFPVSQGIRYGGRSCARHGSSRRWLWAGQGSFPCRRKTEPGTGTATWLTPSAADMASASRLRCRRARRASPGRRVAMSLRRFGRPASGSVVLIAATTCNQAQCSPGYSMTGSTSNTYHFGPGITRTVGRISIITYLRFSRERRSAWTLHRQGWPPTYPGRVRSHHP